MSDEKDPYEIEDRSILTPQEHMLIGSSVDARFTSEPCRPIAVSEGKTPKEVFALRLKQKEIVGFVASQFFGLAAGEHAVINLNMIDLNTGKASPELRLSGILYEGTGKIVRNPEILARHQLSEEGKRMFMVEGEVGRREKIG